jgi:hypothetical protein
MIRSNEPPFADELDQLLLVVYLLTMDSIGNSLLAASASFEQVDTFPL